MEKRYRLLILLPIILLLLYLAISLQHRLWNPNPAFTQFTVGNNEADEHALQLLKHQEEGLIELSKLNTNASDLIYSQLKLNQEIQKVLGRQTSNVTCSRLDSTKDKKGSRKLEWKPKPGRYLLAVCLSGQMSNHLICLEKHMFFAALLNRTLVLPSPSIDYNYDNALDLLHIKKCLSNNTLLKFEEFSAQQNKSTIPIRFLCYMHACFIDDDHEKRLRSLGLSWVEKKDAWPEEALIKGYPSHPHAADIVSKFTCDDEVLAVGDLFFADVEEKWVSQAGGPLQHTCKTLIQPNRLVVLTAQRFLQTFLGRDFLALHFRRHGFLKFCNVKNESCFYPIPQAASCILAKLQDAKSSVIYLSTDAAESETNLLQSLLVEHGHVIPLVHRPEHDSREKWDALLVRTGLYSDNEVIAMLDKTICALASTFIGTAGSTFTEDISRIRREWGTANSCDGYLCEGQQPDFIADVN